MFLLKASFLLDLIFGYEGHKPDPAPSVRMEQNFCLRFLRQMKNDPVVSLTGPARKDMPFFAKFLHMAYLSAAQFPLTLIFLGWLVDSEGPGGGT